MIIVEIGLCKWNKIVLFSNKLFSSIFLCAPLFKFGLRGVCVSLGCTLMKGSVKQTNFVCIMFLSGNFVAKYDSMVIVFLSSTNDRRVW